MKRYTYFVFVLLLIATSTNVWAQVGITIDGYLRSKNMDPIRGATVSLEGGNIKGVSDKNGFFKLSNIKPGKYVLRIQGVGLQPYTENIVLVKDDVHLKTLTIDALGVSIDEVAVSGKYYQNYKFDSISGSLRLQSPILELPQNIQVISSDLMADQQVFDILDGVTRNISGASRQGHWDNQYANIRMRGSKLPAFRNGMNIEASWGPTAEDASVIDRIEFVKGPAGFMLANGEPGGFYNVVTKKPTGHQKGSVQFNMGSFSTYRGALDLDGKLSADGRLLYRLNVAGQKKDFFTKYNYSNRISIAPVVSYKIDSLTTLTLEYTFQGSTYLTNGNYTFSPKQFADPGIRNDFFYGDPSFDPGKLRDHSAYVYLDHKLSPTWKFHGQLAYFNFKMDATSTWLNYMKANGDAPRYYSIADEVGENAFGQFSFAGEEYTGKIKHKILVGADFGTKKFWGDFRSLLDSIPFKDLNVYNPEYGIPGNVFAPIDRSVDTKVRAGGSGYVSSVSYMSFYVHDEMSLIPEKLRFSLGLRYTMAETVGKDKVAEIKDKVFTPRVGLSYSLNKQTSAYALFDQSFVPISGTDWEGKAFKPVLGDDLEVGLKREWFNGKWISSISAYTIRRKNALVEDPDPAHVVDGKTFQAQLGETRTKGIELDITGEIVRGLNVVANYAYTDAKISKATDKSTIGNITPNTAKHITNLWLNYHVYQGSLRGLGIMGGVQSMMGRAIGVTKTSNFKDYFRTDLGFGYQKGRYSISLLVNNLLDNRFLMTAGSISRASQKLIKEKGAVDYYSYIVEARRNIRCGIVYKF